jgi:hypothetical protein
MQVRTIKYTASIIFPSYLMNFTVMLLLQEQGRVLTLEGLPGAGLWRFEHPGKTRKTVARQRGLCYPVIPAKMLS